MKGADKMMTFEKVLEVFNDYLNKDSVLEVVNTKRGYTRYDLGMKKMSNGLVWNIAKPPELLRDALT